MPLHILLEVLRIERGERSWIMAVFSDSGALLFCLYSLPVSGVLFVLQYVERLCICSPLWLPQHQIIMQFIMFIKQQVETCHHYFTTIPASLHNIYPSFSFPCQLVIRQVNITVNNHVCCSSCQANTDAYHSDQAKTVVPWIWLWWI